MLPRKVQKNQPITADLMNNIIDSIRECQIQSGVGYSFNRGSGGTTLSIKTSSGGGGAVRKPCPFEATLNPTTAGYTVSIYPGSINGILADNYALCASSVSSPLSGTTAAASYIMIDGVSDGKQLTSFTMSIDTTAPEAPTPTNPLAPTVFEYPIAVVDTTGIIYQLSPCTQLGAYVEESVIAAGTLNSPYDNAFDVYYYWVIR